MTKVKVSEEIEELIEELKAMAEQWGVIGMKLNNPIMIVSHNSAWLDNKDDVSILQGTSFRIYSGRTLVWDMIVTKDFKGAPCVYEKITGKFYYWENNNG